MSLKSIDNEFKPIDPSKADKNKKADLKQLRKACADFESIFISKLLSNMRKTVGESSLFGNGMGADIYQSLFDVKLAEKIAENGGFGIGAILYKEFAGMEAQNDNELKTEATSIKKIIKNTADKLSQLPVFERIKHFHDVIKSASEKFNVPLDLIYGVIAQESAGNPKVVSKAGAKGLMQLMDSTAVDLGVNNSFNPEENIHGGVRYLREQLDKYNGDLELALAAYNAGPSNVEKYGGVPPFKETQNYIKKVRNYADMYSKRLTDI